MANKEATVAELTENFRSSNAVVLTEYRGLTVAQLKTLRKSISEHATYAVVKNTLTKIAANEAGITSFDDDLVGPSAIAFVHGDTVAVAKALRDFAKANPLLVVKGGYFDGAPLTAAEVGKLADLESREVLLAMEETLTKSISLVGQQLIQILSAGAAKGGDTRGLKSAALLVFDPDRPPLDLRIDSHRSPIEALNELYKTSQKAPYVHWLDEVPVLSNKMKWQQEK